MKKIFQYILSFFIVFLTMVIIYVQPVQAASAYTVTPYITEAVDRYLTEIYIDKYPDMGLEFTYGSVKDKEVLTTLADIVTNGCKSEKDMTDSIAQWVKRNIEYESLYGNTCYYPIDVFYERKGNCVGYAQLMSQLMRLKGIPAVVCMGQRGNMVDYVTVEYSSKRESVGHAWVMAYFDGMWHLYDPLFGEYGSTDKDYISKWYFTNDMEGVSPWYDGMDTTIMLEGYAIFYIGGRFMYYAGGVPASEFYGTGAEGGKNVNGTISYWSKNRYFKGYINDGFEYIDNPERKQKMINDECYSNGWISYGGNLHLTRANGILVANTIRRVDTKLYFMAYDGSALELNGSEEDYTLTDGYITLKKGNQIFIKPTFYESEMAEGKVIVWESMTPEIATIDPNGVITGVSKGLATLGVCSKDTVDGDTHYMYSYIQVYVDEGEDRIPNYEDNIPAASFVKGGKFEKGSVHYEIKSKKGKSGTVVYLGSTKKSKTVKISKTVKVKGTTYTVTEIAEDAFKGNTKMTSVTIPEGVTKIGKNAFNGCKNLKSITIKSSKLKTVGKGAFKGINKKAIIKVPKKQLSKYKQLFKSKTGFKKSMKIKK